MGVTVLPPPLCVPPQEKQEELEELNKELRQCNLQQFIQQAGVLPTHTHSRTDLSDQLDQLELANLLQERYRNGGTDTHAHTHTLSQKIFPP